MSFTDLFIKRPVLSIVMSLLVLLFGARALFSLELRQYPKMTNGVITVTTSYVGASADTVQGFITSPLEKAIASADGIDVLTSSSKQGSSQIRAELRLNYDPNTALAEIMNKVSQVSSQLPKGSDNPIIQKAMGGGSDLIYYGFKSNSMTTPQITDYLIRVVQPKLQTVPGVANVEILGGSNYAMRIWLDTSKMAAFQITPQLVADAIQRENYQSAAGQIKGNFILLNIRAHTDLNTVNEFKQIVLKNINGTVIHLKDIARIEMAPESETVSVKFNGQTGIFIGIQGNPTANPLTVINGVKAIFPEIENNYPPSLTSKAVYDTTEYIRSSIREVTHSIIEATIIIIFVVFGFIGAARAVVIPVVTIPLSLIGVCSLMLAMGYSINLLTLLAMVIAIGLVVDDAIVVVENAYRHIEEGKAPLEAALQGAREITRPVITMTFTLAAVYAPIGLMSGLTGALFKEFAFTLAFAVIISGLIALTLSPMMCSRLLNRDMLKQKLVVTIDHFFDRLRTRYQEYLHKILVQPRAVGTFVLILIVGCTLTALTTTRELAPEEDISFAGLFVESPKYANLNYTEKYTDELEKIFKTFPEHENSFMINGANGENTAFGGMILKPWDARKRKQPAVVSELQGKIMSVPGVRIFAYTPPALPTTDDGMPIQFAILSTDDYEVMNDVAKQLESKAMQSGNFIMAKTTLEFDKPSLEIQVNKEKAAALDIDMETIGQALSTLLGGNYINHFSMNGQSYQVIAQVSDELRLHPEQLLNYYVHTRQGEQVPLGSIIQIKLKTVPDQLPHFQQLNSIMLQAIPMPGVSIPKALEFLRTQAKSIFPSGFSYDYAGQSRQNMQEGYTMVLTFFFALIVIYLILAAQFESFMDPFIILVSVPLSMMGALTPLHLGFATLNIYTGIGLVTLIGLISKHGILMVDFANHLHENENLSRFQAIEKAAALRLRPILMTTVAMVLGVTPLVLANGAGAVSRSNIGLVIASGMMVGTLFTLFVVPSMYVNIPVWVQNWKLFLIKHSCILFKKAASLFGKKYD